MAREQGANEEKGERIRIDTKLGVIIGLYTLVEKAEGPGEAKIGSTITYRVEKYNKENVSNEKKAGVQWDISVNDRQENLPAKGETISIEIQQTWAGMEIVIMPYLVHPIKTVSVKTYCYILEHEILRTDRKLNRLAATGERIDPGTGSEGPAQTLCNAFVELNIMNRDDNKIHYHSRQGDLLRDNKLVNAIKLFEYSYMKKGIDECTEHIEKETIMAVDEALKAGWRFDRHGNSEEYRLDGVYVGIRNYDYFGGIWVQDGYLKNVDDSVMKKEDFEYIAGTVRGEASTHGAPGRRTGINEEELWREAAGIYSVLRNRVTYSWEKYEKTTTVIDRIDYRDGAEGRDRISEMTDIHTAEGGSRTALVVKGIITAIRSATDYSQGSYFWDGEDIKSNEHSLTWGIFYSDVIHDIYRTGNTRHKQTNKSRPGREIRDTHTNSMVQEVYHTLDSVTAIGGTIFWRYCASYKDLMGQSEYNYGP
jgi:hypothetical protein